MKITTPRVDSSSLTAHKTVKIAGNEIGTPVKALQVGKLRKTEDVMSSARGVAETYATASDTKLKNSRRGGYDRLADNLRLQYERAHEDEIVIPFVQYEDTGELSLENAKEIARLQTNFGDILTVPLQSNLTYAVDNGDGLETEEVGTIIANTVNYLNAVEDLEIKKPVMGVFPSISKEVTLELLKIYQNRDIRAFCVDFNRRTATAKVQQDQVIRPLMRSLRGSGDLQERFMYAVNLTNGNPDDSGRRPPEQVYAYTMGFDVVGDVHISPPYPREVFEEMEEPDGVRLFDTEAPSFRDVPLEDLDGNIPSESEFTADQVRQRVEADGDERYRLKNLINVELITMLLEAIEEDSEQELFELLADSEEITDQDIADLREIVAEVRDE